MECIAVVVCFASSVFLVSGLTLNKIPQCPYAQNLYGGVTQQLAPIQSSQEPQVQDTTISNNPYYQHYTGHNDKTSYQIPSGYQQYPGVSNAINDPTDVIIEHLRQHYMKNVLSNTDVQGTLYSNQKVDDVKKVDKSQVSKSPSDPIPKVVNNYFIVSPEYLRKKNGKMSKRQRNESGIKDRRNKARKCNKRQKNVNENNFSSNNSNEESDSTQDRTKKEERKIHESTDIHNAALDTIDNSPFKVERFTLNTKDKKHRRKSKQRYFMRPKINQTEVTKPTNKLLSGEEEHFHFIDTHDHSTIGSKMNNLNSKNKVMVERLRKKVLQLSEDAVSNFTSILRDELNKRKSNHSFSEISYADIDSCNNDLFINTPSHNDKKRRIHRKITKDDNDELLSSVEASSKELVNNTSIQSQFQEQSYSWEVTDKAVYNLSMEEQLGEHEKDPNNYACHEFGENSTILDIRAVSVDTETNHNITTVRKPNHKTNTQYVRDNKSLVQRRGSRNRFCKRKRPSKKYGNYRHNSTSALKPDTSIEKVYIPPELEKQNLKTRPVLKIKSTSNFKSAKRVVEESTTFKSIRTSKSENDDTFTSTPKSEIETVYGHSKVVKYGPETNEDTSPVITYYLPENMQYEVDGKTVVIAKSIPDDSFW